MQTSKTVEARLIEFRVQQTKKSEKNEKAVFFRIAKQAGKCQAQHTHRITAGKAATMYLERDMKTGRQEVTWERGSDQL